MSIALWIWLINKKSPARAGANNKQGKEMFIVLILVLLLTGCNYESPNDAQPQQQEEQEQQEPLHISPYIPDEPTEYSVTLNVELIRGDMSCQGECELPLTGHGSTMFNIETKELLHDIKITSASRSSICYEMDSGWYLINFQYQNRSWWMESQGGCWNSLTEVDLSQWGWSNVHGAVADIRSVRDWRIDT